MNNANMLLIQQCLAQLKANAVPAPELATQLQTLARGLCSKRASDFPEGSSPEP